MVNAPWTAYYDTPNKTRRLAVPYRGVVLHGAVTSSLDALRRLTMGAKEVSASAIVKDGHAERLFDETAGWRAWSLATAWGDSSFRSVETCNAPDLWSFSDATYNTLGWVVAWWAQLDGFRPHREGSDRRAWTVIGHNEYEQIYGDSYATACPQGMDLDRVVRIAQGFLAPQPPPDPFKKARESESSMYVRLDPKTYGPDLKKNPVYEVWRNPATGSREMFVLGFEDSAGAANLAIPYDWGTLSGLAKATGYTSYLARPAVLTQAADTK